MNRWIARLLALIVTAAALYLVYANLHAAGILLESTLAAAVLAIGTVSLAWNRPTAALVLNVVWVGCAFAVPALLTPTHQLPGVAAQPPQSQTNSATTVAMTPATTTAAGSDAQAPNATIDAEAKRIGKDPRALLTRVSDGIRLELYPGVFRGSAATLNDGAGNDADKALLLRDLIRASDPNANLRFASCTLTPQQADVVIANATRAYGRPYVLAQFAANAANDAGTSQKAKTLLTRIASAWSDLVAQAKDRTSRLSAELQSAGLPVKTVSAQDLRSLATTHVWLQQQTAAGWTDLDPSIVQAAPGATICAAGTTMSDLPPEEFVTITLRVHAESRKSGDLTLLKQSWPALALSDKTLAFMFAELTDTKVGAPSPVPTGMTAYTPVIRTGPSIVTGTPLVLPTPYVATGTPVGAAAAKGPAGALAAFGTPAPTPSPTPVPAPVDISAVWLEITVNAPGAAPQTVNSPIFDSVSFADRAAGRTASAQLTPIEQSNGVYLPLADVWNVTVTEGSAVAGAGDHSPLAATADAPSLAAALGRVARSYYAIRPALFAASASAAAPIINAKPGISLAGIVWHPGAKSGTETAAILFDRASDHAVSVGSASSDSVRLGVSSLLAERYAAGGPNMIARRADRVGANDVLTVFDWAPKESVGTIAVRSGGDLSSLGMSADTKARIAASIADGSTAYVPTNVVKLSDANDYYGWWNVRPDGSVQDEMQNGRHVEMEEETEQTEDVLAKNSKFFRRHGGIIRCILVAVAISGATTEGNAEGVGEALHGEYEVEEKIHKMEEVAEGAEDDQNMADVCSE